ncbi:mannose-6-phosphate isomerase, class I [Ornithinimicrobium sp. Arc0846-15]|nr:mannose-6-phosphate isomerase, class I [Ornithinimicrobium laminariae]
MDPADSLTSGTQQALGQSGPGWFPVYPLINPIRHYAWGSAEFIPHLLDLPYTGEPHAEVWVGAHPADSSWVNSGLSLAQRVEQDPQAVLGSRVRAQFGDRLPFLLKILTAARPLSLQVHPNDEQAAAGFAAEEAAGLPIRDPSRRYHDPFGKPEMIVALTDFEALSGVRPLAQTREFFDQLHVNHPDWPGLMQLLVGDDGAELYLRKVLGDPAWAGGLVEAVAQACRDMESAEARTILDLSVRYPGDSGVLVAMLLNRISLKPGEAIYVGPGELHAYLCGAGVEIMGSSDNVLRAGLTSKFIDPDELLSLTDISPRPPRFVGSDRINGMTHYKCPAQEFRLDAVQLGKDETTLTLPCDGPVVVLIVDGSAEVLSSRGAIVHLHRGRAAMVEACAGDAVTLRGHGTAFVARA